MGAPSNFVTPLQIVVVMIHAQHTRTEESDISRKVPRADESFRISQNWPYNSSRILAITRDVEKGFRISAASSSLSSRKYRWNSISKE